MGVFISVEGPEGAGKTTLVESLVHRLRDQGRTVVAVREPGGTRGAELLRDLALNRPDVQWSPAAELFLMLAARAELVREVIGPALATDAVVVTDRFDLSTMAYQVGGRGLDAAQVTAANAVATQGVQPDVTLVLDVDPAVGRERQRRQGKAPDRIEGADPALHARVARAFAQATGDGIVHLDANAPEADLLAAAWAVLSARLDGTPERSEG
jgi:dTMP kinase